MHLQLSPPEMWTNQDVLYGGHFSTGFFNLLQPLYSEHLIDSTFRHLGV